MMRNIFSMINHCPWGGLHDCIPATAARFYCFLHLPWVSRRRSPWVSRHLGRLLHPRLNSRRPLRGFFRAAPTGLFPPPLRGSIVLSHLPWVSRHRGCPLHPRLNSIRPYGAFSTALRAVKCCLWQLYNVLLVESTCHLQG